MAKKTAIKSADIASLWKALRPRRVVTWRLNPQIAARLKTREDVEEFERLTGVKLRCIRRGRR